MYVTQWLSTTQWVVPAHFTKLSCLIQTKWAGEDKVRSQTSSNPQKATSPSRPDPSRPDRTRPVWNVQQGPRSIIQCPSSMAVQTSPNFAKCSKYKLFDNSRSKVVQNFPRSTFRVLSSVQRKGWIEKWECLYLNESRSRWRLNCL